MGMKSMLKSPILSLFFFSFFSFLLVACSEESWNVSSLVRKDQRKSLVETEYGEISAVEVSDGTKSGRYHLQFFTLEPNALFLPVLLHADMVLYVHTGSGSLNRSPGDKEVMTVPLQRGDIYRIPPGSIFFLKNELKPERESLRIYAIFTASNEDLSATSIGAYSSITEMVRGFDKKVLQAAFKVPEDVIEAITNSSTPAIVHALLSPKLGQLLDWETTLIRAFVGGARGAAAQNSKKKKKKAKPFNVLKESPDFKNCNGWSLSVTEDDLPSLKQSNIGILFVNLTKGSMMGPHWNPMASEVAMVVQGAGMVQVVCASSATNESECKNRKFRVEEGDVFAVPRFHPMAQMSFNNDSLVFVGFSTATKKNYPQFLAGKTSVLQVLDKDVLAVAFGVSNTTIKQVLAPQGDSIILECTSCAEEEEMKMQEEIQKEKEEEEARKREEKRREEEKKKEEAAKKREEEEEKRREEEEEKRKEEEEAKKREEEEKKREEEEAKKREEEEKKREEEEEEARRQREGEEEEEQAKKEDEERARKEQEEQKRREEEEGGGEEGRRQREGEGEEDEAKKQDEERARKEEEQEKRREKEEAGGEGGRRVLLKRWKF